jgi:hypothetical protein
VGGSGSASQLRAFQHLTRFKLHIALSGSVGSKQTRDPKIVRSRRFERYDRRLDSLCIGSPAAAGFPSSQAYRMSDCGPRECDFAINISKQNLGLISASTPKYAEVQALTSCPKEVKLKVPSVACCEWFHSCVLHTAKTPRQVPPENAITMRISSPLHAQASAKQTAPKCISRSVQQHAQSREGQPDR